MIELPSWDECSDKLLHGGKLNPIEWMIFSRAINCSDEEFQAALNEAYGRGRQDEAEEKWAQARKQRRIFG